MWNAVIYYLPSSRQRREHPLNHSRLTFSYSKLDDARRRRIACTLHQILQKYGKIPQGRIWFWWFLLSKLLQSARIYLWNTYNMVFLYLLNSVWIEEKIRIIFFSTAFPPFRESEITWIWLFLENTLLILTLIQFHEIFGFKIQKF